MENITESAALEERAKYVAAFNDTMIKIWKEQITLLNVIDTGRLLHSPVAVGMSADGKFSEIRLSQAFLEYGLWQDYGTGKEIPRGNNGDLGKPKVRKERHWFSRKYYMSVMNIKEFMADSLGRQFQGILSEALDQKKFSRNHWKSEAIGLAFILSDKLEFIFRKNERRYQQVMLCMSDKTYLIQLILNFWRLEGLDA